MSAAQNEKKVPPTDESPLLSQKLFVEALDSVHDAINDAIKEMDAEKET